MNYPVRCPACSAADGVTCDSYDLLDGAGVCSGDVEKFASWSRERACARCGARLRVHYCVAVEVTVVALDPPRDEASS